MAHAGGPTEDETCRLFVLPALAAAGWTDTQTRPQYQINDGKITAARRLQTRGEKLIADYVLEIAPGLPIGVVEAKRTRASVARGVEQARRYMSRLYLPFAYATNGREIYEIDAVTGRQQPVAAFPSPDQLWNRYRQRQQLDSDLAVSLTRAPFNRDLRNTDTSAKLPRYYQRVAVNRTMRAIAADQRRILLVLATGTGKTMVAFQIVAKLREAHWPDGRMPRVLYLADRDIAEGEVLRRWFAEDSRRSEATWINNRSLPLLWAYDRKRYTPTGLVQEIRQIVESFGRLIPVEFLARPAVEAVGDGIEVDLCGPTGRFAPMPPRRMGSQK